jgi:serine/threonine protein kinase/formylglycine-generating enzyme required for sulfatase activity
LEAVAEHVEQCPDCQATLLTLADVEDTLVAQLRRPFAADPYSEEAECRAVAASAKAMVDESRSTGRAEDDATMADGPLPRQLGEFQLLEKLGQGGMGTVYLARHTRLDRIVALKLLPQQNMSDPRLRARFDKEMKAVGRLNHPNIVQAHDARDIEGVPVLVMEYVEGMDLGRVAALVGPLPIADACEAARQAAEGLQAAHEHGLVHRDVKPSNLMLARGGQVKILDLGLARLAPFSPDTAAPPNGVLPVSLTSGFSTMGTADYMAPEQVTDAHLVDIRADVYSLGCTLYRLLAARTPFSGPGYVKEAEKMIGQVRDVPRPLVQWRPDVPAELAAVIERMMAKEQAARFATPAEVAEALKPFTAAADLCGLLDCARQRQERNAGESSTPSESAITDPHVSSELTGTEPGKRAEPDASQPKVESSGQGALARANKRRRRRKILTAVGAAAAVAVALLAAIILVSTDRGTLEIKTLDDDIKVSVTEGGRFVQIVDPKTSHEVSLRSGHYEVQLAGGKDGLSLSTDKFVLRRGGRVVVEVLPPATPAPLPPAVSVKADVFNMPGGQTSLQFVNVGNPGNAADPSTGYGAVGYAYQMGMYEVTTAQYCQFLNAVAANDPYGLYNTYMYTGDHGGGNGCAIQQSGSPGSFTYSISAEWANRPVNHVSWGDAARFCNWLQNGQPRGAEGDSTTETGAYTLSGATDLSSLAAVTRNPSATYFVPTVNEWCKAAYYDPNKPGGAGYWTYPTRSNTPPSNVVSSTGTNNANFGNWSSLPPSFLTEVGTFAKSPSPYGTFDQGGNVIEWTDTTTDSTHRALLGGDYYWGADWLAAGHIDSLWPSDVVNDQGPGFRVAKVGRPAKEPRKGHDPDRRAAMYVLGAGGAVTVSAAGTEREAKSVLNLPKEPFRVVAVNLDGIKSVADDGLANLVGLTECRFLSLNNTSITDSGLRHLKDFTKLDVLFVRFTAVTGQGWVHLQGSPGLKQLWLFGARVDDEGFANVKYFPGLQFLELDNTAVTDKGFANIGCLKDLRRLVSGHGPLTDASLKAIGELTHLEKLWFYSTQITSQGLAHLSKLPALDHLGLAGCRQLDDRVADTLKGFRSLKSIDLSDTAVTATGAAKIHAVLPDCTVGGFDK